MLYQQQMGTATVQQRKFAQGIALGLPATKAYKAAHPNAKTKGVQLRNMASRSKKTKAVQEELARLLADPMLQPLVTLPFPEYQDHNKLIEHAVGVMVRLSSYHADPIVQMHAAMWLFDYGKTLKEEKRAKTKESREDLLRDLRGIYSKALPNPKLMVEEVTDSPVIEAEVTEVPPEETGWTPTESDESAESAE